MAASPELDLSVVVNAPLNRVIRAFFDGDALHAWWQVVRSVTTPRTLGPYAVEWAPTDFRDDILGRLGGVFHGTIVQFDPGRGFFVADAYWLAPDGDPIGPMALEVVFNGVVSPTGSAEGATAVRVRQTGFEESARWRRYYEVVGVGWERALHSLRMLLEK
ncbi:MAG TPA: SRPBCC domain-containing protein [Vicinamibacterales bacterium]|nr:SRPBCC domain-containing protein [Vicinamibacterales bacterium]